MRQRALSGLVLAIVASAVLGLAAGLIWNMVSPRAALLEVSAGTAQVVNPETRAFIGADGWYCVIAGAAGLLTGVVGYRAGIARRAAGTRVAMTVGLILGAIAGGLVMLWLGEQIGHSAYQHDLAASAAGTTFNASLVLGAKSALAFWPLLTSLVIVLAEIGRHRDTDRQPVEMGPVSSMWTGQQEGDAAP